MDLSAITTVDDVTQLIDELAAHVVWMEIPEDQRKVALDALDAALKAIMKSQ